LTTIRICQKIYPLYWDLYAEKRISEKMGKERVFADWLRDTENRFEHISFVLVELINGGIRKKNAMIAAGFSSDEKETVFQMTDEEQESFLSLFRVADFPAIQDAIILEYIKAYQVEIPEEIKKNMPDDDYLEIEAEMEAEKDKDGKN
jgi:hypothetical protein